MRCLFHPVIDGWASWGRVYQDRAAFGSLAEAILEREGLEPAALERCTPGTHAVFKAGPYILKIYAPAESGNGAAGDWARELWGLQTAASRGALVTRPVASGCIEDRYTFYYLVTEYVDGVDFAHAVQGMTAEDKRAFGRRLRTITDRLNQPVPPGPQPVDLVQTALANERWRVYPPCFQQELAAFVQGCDLSEPVFVHADLNPDNLILGPDGGVTLLDFGDALTAPVCYEQAVVASALFRFDPPFLQGYFADRTAEELTDLCLTGLLLHDFGADLLRDLFGAPARFDSIAAVRGALAACMV